MVKLGIEIKMYDVEEEVRDVMNRTQRRDGPSGFIGTEQISQLRLDQRVWLRYRYRPGRTCPPGVKQQRSVPGHPFFGLGARNQGCCRLLQAATGIPRSHHVAWLLVGLGAEPVLASLHLGHATRVLRNASSESHPPSAIRHPIYQTHQSLHRSTAPSLQGCSIFSLSCCCDASRERPARPWHRILAFSAVSFPPQVFPTQSDVAANGLVEVAEQGMHLGWLSSVTVARVLHPRYALCIGQTVTNLDSYGKLSSSSAPRRGVKSRPDTLGGVVNQAPLHPLARASDCVELLFSFPTILPSPVVVRRLPILVRLRADIRGSLVTLQVATLMTAPSEITTRHLVQVFPAALGFR